MVPNGAHDKVNNNVKFMLYDWFGDYILRKKAEISMSVSDS